MLDIKKLIHGIYVGVNQKESFSSKEVYDIINQTKNAIISEASGDIEKAFNEREQKIQELSKFIEDQNKNIEDYNSHKTEYETKINDLTSEIANKNITIKEFETSKEINTAKELLKGMVVKGAEVEVYEKVKPLIANHKFAPDVTLEERQAMIKDDIESFIEKKPWFSPRDVVQSDDKGLVRKTVNKSQTKNDDDNPNIFKPTGNVIRRGS